MFKAGDRVRFKEDYSSYFKTGDVATVISVRDRGEDKSRTMISVENENKSTTNVFAKRLELVEPETSFKVGDEVHCSDNNKKGRVTDLNSGNRRFPIVVTFGSGMQDTYTLSGHRTMSSINGPSHLTVINDEAKPIFKVGDRVQHRNGKKGTVDSTTVTGMFPVRIAYDNNSRTEYTLSGQYTSGGEVVISLLNETGEKKEEVMFKKGDKVYCAEHERSGTVIETNGNSLKFPIVVKFDNDKVGTYTVKGQYTYQGIACLTVEKVSEKSLTDDQLLQRALEGEKAFTELKARRPDLQCSINAGRTWESPASYEEVTYRFKPKPKMEEYTTEDGNHWRVRHDEASDYIHIGCKSFHRGPLKEGLESMIDGNKNKFVHDSTGVHFTFLSTRLGITCGEYSIGWVEAGKLYKLLTEMEK